MNFNNPNLTPELMEKFNKMKAVYIELLRAHFEKGTKLQVFITTTGVEHRPASIRIMIGSPEDKELLATIVRQPYFVLTEDGPTKREPPILKIDKDTIRIKGEEVSIRDTANEFKKEYHKIFGEEFLIES